MNGIDEVLKHGYLLIGVAVGLTWLLRRVSELKKYVKSIVDERLPVVLHQALKNGIRDMVTAIVQEAIAKHALAEEHVIHARLNKLEARMDDLENAA